jgi:hypothetical protein
MSAQTTNGNQRQKSVTKYTTGRAHLIQGIHQVIINMSTVTSEFCARGIYRLKNGDDQSGLGL